MLQLVLNLVATCVMVGVIWFVQLVHYPLLALIGIDRAPEIAVEHQRRTAWVVGLPMAVEGVTTLVLLFARPDGVDARLAWLGAVILAVVLASTVLLSVPLHERMANSPDTTIGRRLVVTNWPRTIGWTARAIVAGIMLSQAI
ncbi:MAG: hypothetical protein ACKO3L_05010 [Actinomycetota bacterium]